MAVRTTQIVSCDHIHESDGEKCTVERAQSKIDPTEPMYHLNIEIEVIDADGHHQMVKEDIHLCFWDLYYHLSAYHDQAKIDIIERKRQAATNLEQLEAADNEILMDDRLR